MTEYGLGCKTLPSPPPLDFSRYRLGLEACNPPSSSILDLRVKKLSERTDKTSRNMLEYHVGRTGTRTTSDSTEDSAPHSPPHMLPVPAFQTFRPIPMTAPLEPTPQRRLPPNVDAPLHESSSNHESLRRLLSLSSQQLSPHQENLVTPDTTVANFPSPTLSSKRDSQYHAAFRRLAARDIQNSADPRTPAYLDSSAYNRLLPFSELSLDRISGERDLSPVAEKASSFLPLSMFSHDWKPGSLSIYSRGKQTANDVLKAEEPTSSFPECDFPQGGFRRDAADESGSGSDGEQQLPVSSGSQNGVGKDEAYWERRRKNNEAAKKSRDARRAKEDEIAVRAAVLEKENICLKLNLAALKKEHQRLLFTLR